MEKNPLQVGCGMFAKSAGLGFALVVYRNIVDDILLEVLSVANVRLAY